MRYTRHTFHERLVDICEDFDSSLIYQTKSCFINSDFFSFIQLVLPYVMLRLQFRKP